MSVETINQIFYQVIDRQLDRVMLYKQTVKWIPISSRELYRDAVGIARSLHRWGIAKGDRVAILSENRPEWATAEFGTLLIGAVIVPIYSTLTAEQSAFMLADSGARVAFVSTVEQLKKLQAVAGRHQAGKNRGHGLHRNPRRHSHAPPHARWPGGARCRIRRRRARHPPRRPGHHHLHLRHHRHAQGRHAHPGQSRLQPAALARRVTLSAWAT